MRRNLVAFALAAVAALGALGVQPAPVAAANGYAETGATTYRLDPTKGVVRVTVTMRFTNQTPDGREPYACTENTFDWWFGWRPTPSTCYRTTRYFFNSTRVWVENGASSIKASSNGKALKATTGAKGDRYRPVTVSFPDLFNGETRSIQVTYVIKGGAPRTTSSVRAMQAYASFCAIANGADSATVSVRVPGGFALATTGSPMSAQTSGKERIYSSGRIADPANFWACFDGTNDAGYRTVKLTAAGGRDVTLKSWPEDPAWAKGVRAELASGLPALAELVGRPMSGTAPLVIREAITGGEYAGFYDAETSTITVDEDFKQPSLVQHELAHVWFNGSTFTDTWLSEGHAEWAGRAVSGDEKPCARPSGSGSGVTLATWLYASPRATKAELAAVQAEYDAACYVVTKVAAVAGAGRMTAALAGLLQRRDPYATDPAVKRETVVATWRDWLDAVDELALAPAGAPVDTASTLLLEYGATDDRATLTRRTAARAAYHALAAEVEDWVVPAAVRNSLAAWDFGTATTAVAAAEPTWTITGETDETLGGVDARHGPAADAWAAAATVDELDAAAALARTQLQAAHDVAATAALVGQPLDLAQLAGLVGTQLPSLDPAVDAVRNADGDTAARITASVRATITGLREVGRSRIAIVIAAMVTVLSMAILLLVRRVQAGSRRRRAVRVGAGPTGTPAGAPAGGAAWARGGGAASARGGGEAAVLPVAARPAARLPDAANVATGSSGPPVAIGTAGPIADDSPTQVWTLPFTAPPAGPPIPVRPPSDRPPGV